MATPMSRGVAGGGAARRARPRNPSRLVPSGSGAIDSRFLDDPS
jgi:hypothetical protein